MKDIVKERMRDKMFIFDKNTNLITIIKLCKFILKNKIGCPEIFKNLYWFKGKNGQIKFMLTNLTASEIRITKSVTTIDEIWLTPIDESTMVKLKSDGYTLIIHKYLSFFTLRKEGTSASVTYYIRADYKKNMIILDSISSIIKYDKFKDNGFGNFVSDITSTFRINLGYGVSSDNFKAFLNPNYKKHLDYDPNIKYDTKPLQMMFMASKLGKSFSKTINLGPFRFTITNWYVSITVLKRTTRNINFQWVEYKRLEDIKDLNERSINLISYILNNYPGSIRVRSLVSNLVLNSTDEE